MKPRAIVVALLTIVAVAGGQGAVPTLFSWTSVLTRSLAAPGDLNGDGLPDFVGGMQGDWSLAGWVKAYSSFDGSVIWTATGAPGQFFGASIAVAGDLDGDGRPEIIISAPGFNGTGGAPTLIVSGATGALFRTIPFVTKSVDGGRDFNGDGVPDQLGVCSDGVRVFSGTSGAVIFTAFPSTYGGGTSFNACFMKDVDLDGKDDLALGFPNTPSLTAQARSYVLRGPNGAIHTQITDGVWGGGSVADVGDLTGDGRSELAIYERIATSGIYDFAVYDVAGGGQMPSSSYLWALYPNLYYGRPASIPDVNNDGVRDLLVPHTYSSGGYTYGQCDLISGLAATTIRYYSGASLFTNPAGPGQIGPVVSIGDVNLDGKPDFVRSYTHTIGVQSAELEVVSTSPLPTPSSSYLGTNCGAYPMSFSAGGLRLGQTWSFGILGAAPFASGQVVIDVGAPAPSPIGPCTVYVNLAHAATWIVLPFTTSSYGQGYPFPVSVPNIPIFAGLTAVAQAVVYGTGSPLGADISTAVLATAGF